MRYEVMPESFKLAGSKRSGVRWSDYIEDFLRGKMGLCRFVDLVPEHYKNLNCARNSLVNHIRKYHLEDKLKTFTENGILYLMKR